MAQNIVHFGFGPVDSSRQTLMRILQGNDQNSRELRAENEQQREGNRMLQAENEQLREENRKLKFVKWCQLHQCLPLPLQGYLNDVIVVGWTQSDFERAIQKFPHKTLTDEQWKKVVEKAEQMKLHLGGARVMDNLCIRTLYDHAFPENDLKNTMVKPLVGNALVCKRIHIPEWLYAHVVDYVDKEFMPSGRPQDDIVTVDELVEEFMGQMFLKVENKGSVIQSFTVEDVISCSVEFLCDFALAYVSDRFADDEYELRLFGRSLEGTKCLLDLQWKEGCERILQLHRVSPRIECLAQFLDGKVTSYSIPEGWMVFHFLDFVIEMACEDTVNYRLREFRVNLSNGCHVGQEDYMKDIIQHPNYNPMTTVFQVVHSLRGGARRPRQDRQEQVNEALANISPDNPFLHTLQTFHGMVSNNTPNLLQHFINQMSYEQISALSETWNGSSQNDPQRIVMEIWGHMHSDFQAIREMERHVASAKRVVTLLLETVYVRELTRGENIAHRQMTSLINDRYEMLHQQFVEQQQRDEMNRLVELARQQGRQDALNESRASSSHDVRIPDADNDPDQDL